jgi:RES domain-containing protein
VIRSAYRLVRARHAARAFDGEGARRYGGRWNPVGTPAVYLASHRSLAVLEILANLERTDALSGFVFFEVRFDERWVERLDPKRLPGNWRRPEPPSALARLGAAWAAEGRSLLLEVPSAVVPPETNLVLDPRHPDFGAIEIGAAEPYELDRRLIEGAAD